MLMSLCIPCHKRTYDLKKIMPYLIEAAEASPPVEIVVVDYNSPDDLWVYLRSVMALPIKNETSFFFCEYTGRNYYHMAHARNLSVLASHGEYVVISGTDILYNTDFFSTARKIIAETDCDWMAPPRYCGALIIRRSEFIAAGGFDERMEFYGPEDKELAARLRRREAKFVPFPGGLIDVLDTPDSVKVQNYRLQINKREMHHRMKAIWDENEANGVLVANPDGWGKWD